MYFTTLKSKLTNVEEKKFYDVCIMYLSRLGYKDLTVIDGTGDGGRDVICSREDLRIQLSVRKDWEKKINEEAKTTLDNNRRHLLFLTNRDITNQSEQKFLDEKYLYKGEVDVSIHSTRKIATALAQPGVIRKSYEMLGEKIPKELHATPKEIATSTVLLFSDDAKELRDSIIEANIKAILYKEPGLSASVLLSKVAEAIPGTNIERVAKSSLNRLRSTGSVKGREDTLRLSSEDIEKMKAAETEFSASYKSDIELLESELGLSEESAKRLLGDALEILIRKSDLDGVGPYEESLRNTMSELGLNHRKSKTYETLSRTASSRIKQHGQTIDQIFSTNTFDIYRALGKRVDLTMVLDSSVAMPVLFGLEFGGAKSRYGLAALALKDACKAHNINMVVPRCYINEAASHGLRALETLEVYESLDDSIKTSFKASENAYLSHYTHIKETLESDGEDLSLEEFLKHFSITRGEPTDKIENKISSILDMHGIKEMTDARYDQSVYDLIIDKKPHSAPILIKHDAMVCTKLRNDDEHGYIFATWDKAIVNVVENIARILADTPARIIDFLSMSMSQDYECQQSYELLTSLIYVDEKPAQKLADHLEKINSVEQAYKFNRFITAARQSSTGDWSLQAEDAARFLEETGAESRTGAKNE